MTLFIGMDEAGYGPLLGPLVIGRALLEGGDEEPGLPLRPDPALRVADSKEILARRDGLAVLEAVVLGVHAATTGSPPATLAEFLALDGRGDLARRLARRPWYAALDLPLPFAADADRLARAWEAAERGRLVRGARIRSLGIRVLDEGALNEDWRQSGNKHASLFAAMLAVLDELEGLAEPGLSRRVSIDRLGGRTRYEPMLAGAYPFVPCEVLVEEREESRYRLALPRGETEIRFLVKGDARCAEIALASMAAKYAREALMAVFNDYWRARVPELRPTAGYYEDGRRFLGDLERSGLVDPATLAALARRR